MTSLFTRRARFGERARENRLTEAFACVLERVDGLAYEAVLRWLDPDNRAAGASEVITSDEAVGVARNELVARAQQLNPRPWVRTQVFTVGGRRVDLELRFGTADSPRLDDLLFWIEVKHGAVPARDQVHAYVAEDVARAVVVLGPRGDLDRNDPQVPANVPQRSWEVTARLMGAERGRKSTDTEQWLVREFLDYLMEEGLTMPEPADDDIFAAWRAQVRADAALAEILTVAHPMIQDHCGSSAGEDDIRGFGHGDSFKLPPSPVSDEWDGGWFAWAAGGDGVVAGDNRLWFHAGVSIEAPARHDSGPISRRWIGRLEQLHEWQGVTYEFRLWKGPSKWMRLHRWTYPEDVFAGAETIEDQGAALARWVTGTYERLAEVMRTD